MEFLTQMQTLKKKALFWLKKEVGHIEFIYIIVHQMKIRLLPSNTL